MKLDYESPRDRVSPPGETWFRIKAAVRLVGSTALAAFWVWVLRHEVIPFVLFGSLVIASLAYLAYRDLCDLLDPYPRLD